MSIRTKHEALSVLGLPDSASHEDIKAAYRAMMKIYHPDEHPDSEYDERYYLVTEAYEFLASGAVSQAVEQRNAGQPMSSGPKIFGNSAALWDAAKRRREYQSKVQKENRLEKHRQKEKEERLRRLEEEGHRLKEQEKRRDDLYKQAMAKIEAIQAAMAIEAALKAYKERNMTDEEEGTAGGTAS